MTHKKSKIFTLLGLLTVLALPVHAVSIEGIAVPTPWQDWPDYESSIQGECIAGVGLGCTYAVDDTLFDPASGGTLDATQPLGTAVIVRAAIYTTTNLLFDPGLLDEVGKVNADPDGTDEDNVVSNPLNIYDEWGDLIPDSSYYRGFWSYTGDPNPDYLVVKAGDRAFVWNFEDQVLYKDDNDPSAPVIGYWDLCGWYGTCGGGGFPALSFSAVFIGENTPPQQVPTPPTLLLFGSLFGFIAWKKRRS